MSTPVKIFVATYETQGQRENDFTYCEEGELVIFPIIPCTHEEIDGPCGCRRSMGGLRSSRATTKMKVVEFAGGRDLLVQEIQAWLDSSGWLKTSGIASLIPWEEKSPDCIADRIIAAAARFPVGAIVEWRNGVFQQRVHVRIEEIV